MYVTYWLLRKQRLIESEWVERYAQIDFWRSEATKFVNGTGIFSPSESCWMVPGTVDPNED